MGDVVAFKTCRWSGNGLCIATEIFACVCHRGAASKMLTALGRPPKSPRSPQFLGWGRDAGSIADYALDYTTPADWPAVAARECPPPWEAPQAASSDLIAFAKSGGPPEGRTIEITERRGGDTLQPESNP